MKVLQILPELSGGGVERGTLEVGRHLVEHGHESLVISNGGRMVAQLESEGSRHITLPVHRKSLASFFQVKPLRKILEQEKPDILHLRSRVPAWLAWLAWRKMDPQSRPRLVTTVHGFYSVNRYSKIMTAGERVICVSNSVREYVLKHYPDVPEHKLRVIHRGVDPADLPFGYQPPAEWLEQWYREFPQTKGKYLVTLPGRITRWKGHLDFVKVIADLSERGLPVHGLFVGEAHPRKLEFFEEVKKAVSDAQLQHRITFVGHRKDVRDVLGISDVVVSCSTDPEAFGRVTLEALALGKPVAAYAHGGVAEQLEAFLPEGKMRVGDTQGIADCLGAWFKQPPTPRRSERFSRQAMLESTLAEYQALAVGGTPAA